VRQTSSRRLSTQWLASKPGPPHSVHRPVESRMLHAGQYSTPARVDEAKLDQVCTSPQEQSKIESSRLLDRETSIDCDVAHSGQYKSESCDRNNAAQRSPGIDDSIGRSVRTGSTGA